MSSVGRREEEKDIHGQWLLMTPIKTAPKKIKQTGQSGKS